MQSDSSEMPWSALIDGVAPNGEPIASVVFGRRFAIDGGRAAPLDDGFALQRELVYHEGITYPGRMRPSLLKRDVDVYAWRNLTDLVVQGVSRGDKPVTTRRIRLTCAGPKTDLSLEIVATGDRWVEQGPSGLRLTDPLPFTEMPVRYDRAYGGTDEAAEAKYADPLYQEIYSLNMTEDEDREICEHSYPRNPAGKGYLVDPEGAIGLAWPNLELPEDRLSLSRLAAPADRWGDRPYPAGLDWFPHAWFPRVASFGDFMPTHDGRVPDPEAKLGIVDPGIADLPLMDRPKHGFAQGAHPFLSRRRLEGDEQIRVTSMSRDGRDLEVALPDLHPSVKLRLDAGREVVLPAAIDLVFIEAEIDRVTLLWRATLIHDQKHLRAGWQERSSYKIEWG